MQKFLKTFYFPVLCGIAIGWLMYGIIVHNAYDALAGKIKEVKVFDKIVERDPAFYALINDSNYSIKSGIDTSEIEWRLLTNLGVIPTTKFVDEIAPNIKKQLDKVLDVSGKRLNSITFLDIFIETLNLNMHNQHAGQPQNKLLENYIANCIARKPQSLYYLQAYNKNTDRLNDGAVQKPDSYQYFIPRAVNQSVWGGDVNLNNLLGVLYQKNEFHTDYEHLPNSVKNVSNTDYYEDYRQLRDFHQRLLMSLNDVPEVLHAKNHIFYVEGPEQLAMEILTAIALLMLLQRILRVKRIFGFDDSHPDFIRNLKRWFRWITVSMPLFGFIGTKRGLSNALSQSDSIIRAGSEVNQAMTMNNVTYSLGIAFTTTLVALVLSLTLNFLDNIVKGYEKDFETE